MKSKEKKNKIMEWAYPLAGERASLAHWQSTHGNFFLIRNPSNSQLWNTKPIRWLIKQAGKAFEMTRKVQKYISGNNV